VFDKYTNKKYSCSKNINILHKTNNCYIELSNEKLIKWEKLQLKYNWSDWLKFIWYFYKNLNWWNWQKLWKKNLIEIENSGKYYFLWIAYDPFYKKYILCKWWNVNVYDKAWCKINLFKSCFN